MVDSYMPSSNANNLDSFPSFKSFHEPKTDQDPFTIDERDIAEMKANQSKETISATNATKKPNSNTSIQCDICLVPISSEIVYNIHITGRKHKAILTALLAKNPEYKQLTYAELCSKKQESVGVNDQNESPQTSSVNVPVISLNQFVCDACNITCNSQQMFEKHIIGKKHQMKMKLTGPINPTPVRSVSDNNPSSSNYCDVCSIQLRSEGELTEHLTQKRHQSKVKDAETCAKMAMEMNINFDDYKISSTTTDKNVFNYECTRCNKKTSDKIQLVYHLKSTSHIRLANQANKEVQRKDSKRGKYSATQGGTKRDGLVTRNQGQFSSRGPNKSLGKPRPYRTQRPPWNQPTQPPVEQTSENPFGAFDPYNQAIYPTELHSYPPMKRPAEYEEIPSEYDGFFPKRSCTYNDQPDNSQDYYSNNVNYPQWDTSYYPPPQDSTYPDQAELSKPAWPYKTEPYYDQQQYPQPEPDYNSQMYYPQTQPPLPSYQPPPLPDYPPPPPPPEPYYAQNSAYSVGTENQSYNQYYPPPFQY